MNHRIKVVDSIMGSGKTSAMINKMKMEKDKKFIYITPYLDEVARIKEECSELNFYEPTNSNTTGTKLEGFKKLMLYGNNIVSTHSLFSNVDDACLNHIKANGYTLILDEVFEVVSKLQLTKHDVSVILKEYVEIEQDNRVRWIEGKYCGRFNDVREMCNNNSIYLHNSQFFFWCFPVEIFDAFEETYVLTYLFEGQLQKHYYDMYNVEYEYLGASKLDDNYVIGDKVCDFAVRDNLKDLITIYDGKMNSNYFLVSNTTNYKKTELSSTWIMNAPQWSKDQLKANLRNYFVNLMKSSTSNNLWTTKKSFKGDIKGKGYSKSFITLNTRATNTYSDRNTLAYVYNKYLNPIDKQFFKYKGIEVDEEMLALSEMLQWIWRSAIRNGEPINIYIPSTRMRELLMKYLDCEI